jgi:high-affinity iron transporter
MIMKSPKMIIVISITRSREPGDAPGPLYEWGKKVAVMFKRIGLLLLMLFVLIAPHGALAKGNAGDDMKQAQALVTQALTEAKQGKLAEAKAKYDEYSNTWLDIEDGVKGESGQAYKDVESKMGKVIYALSTGNQEQSVQALQGLSDVQDKFITGGYPKGEKLKTENITLTDFIGLLKDVKEQTGKGAVTEAVASMQKVTDSWLSVEGVVVAQSQKAYTDTERDMVTVQAMLSAAPPDTVKVEKQVDDMIVYLTPLAEKSGYTMWDAAMIIIREGLEALLVVTALLAFVSRSTEKKGRGWIWSGVLTGLGLSIILGVIVKFVFSSGAFGSNNALIAGWTGVIAAVMLLYVSYWLHSNSNIAEWNRYIREKSQAAFSTGKMISLGVISFLAIFREGTETVLFLIGMVNQISMQDLLLGLLAGFGLLILLAYVMIFVGVKLPVRPFFLVSSVIVFYLCLKFTGMGIHSLQLAGTLSTTNVAGIPNIQLFALYPSLESALPQLALLLIALGVLAWGKLSANKQQQKGETA